MQKGIIQVVHLQVVKDREALYGNECITSPESAVGFVKNIIDDMISEYALVLKQACQLKEEKGMMLALAASYRRERIRIHTDEKYGEGAAEFFARASKKNCRGGGFCEGERASAILYLCFHEIDTGTWYCNNSDSMCSSQGTPSVYCAYCQKMIQKCKKPVVGGDF